MKTLMKSTDISPMESFRREMDRIFDDLAPFSRRKGNGGRQVELWAPDTDMSETNDKYLISIDLPGLTKNDIKVNYKDNRLTISGKRSLEESEEEKDFLRRERYFGKFTRSFTVPSEIKENEIKAKFKDGVLRVTVPKSEVRKPKEVPID